MVFTDWWQLPPVLQTAIFANPFDQTDARVQYIHKMFWNNNGKNSMNKMIELTEAKRCKDKWLLRFIQECRHGKQQWEMYNFIHGFPTKFVGSWMPPKAEGDRYTLLCENENCYRLCDTIWPAQRQRCTPWSEIVKAECERCRNERDTRCRVQLDVSKDRKHLQSPFPDAPYLHPFNQPRYHALLSI